MLNPYPEPQLKGYVLSHNTRNISKSTFMISQKPYGPYTSKQSNTFASRYRLRNTLGARRFKLPDRLVGDAYRQAPSAFVAIVLASVAQRKTTCRQAPHVLVLSCLVTSTWRVTYCCRVPLQYSRSTGSGLISGTEFHSLTHIFTQPIQSLCLGSIKAPTILHHHHNYYTQNFSFKVISLKSLVTHSLKLLLCFTSLL